MICPCGAPGSRRQEPGHSLAAMITRGKVWCVDSRPGIVACGGDGGCLFLLEGSGWGGRGLDWAEARVEEEKKVTVVHVSGWEGGRLEL